MKKKKIYFDDTAIQTRLFDDLDDEPEVTADEEPVADKEPRTAIRFMSFGSGSSGNCSYIGDGTTGFLIDAGVDSEYVIEKLRLNGITMDKVAGIILTHDHSDHVRRVYTFLRRNRHLLVYSTPKALNGILRRHSISRRLTDYHSPIYKEFEFALAGFKITPFDVPHDGTDNVGFFIEHPCGLKICVATDIGNVNDRAMHYLQQANAVVLESNHDVAMLLDGPYPEHLKQRILNPNGHLSNDDCAACLTTIMSDKLSHIFLCHLSKDNNTPELALQTSRRALLTSGVPSVGDASESLEALKCPVQLYALPRTEASPLFFLHPQKQ
ncbi:MAG: MBL fold metallo-hydrolase [Muribaculaceae bacterium]|nr:MBL fold metallo-hydrolase [Muribaculaceae bacterium]